MDALTEYSGYVAFRNVGSPGDALLVHPELLTDPESGIMAMIDSFAKASPSGSGNSETRHVSPGGGDRRSGGGHS